MYCVKCGAELLPAARFCNSCGSAAANPIATPHVRGVGEEVASFPPKKLDSKRPTYRFVLGFAGIAMVAGGAYWYQVERNMVRAPEYKVGDTWKFRPHCTQSDLLFWRDRVDDRCNNPIVLQIEFVGDDGYQPIRTKTTYASGLSETDTKRDSLWYQDIDNPKPPEGTMKLRFPLTPGKSWQTSETPELVRKTGFSWRQQYRVEAWETISLRGGMYRTLPVTIENSIYYRSSGEPVRTTITKMWYSPETKVAVRSERDGLVTEEVEFAQVQ